MERWRVYRKWKYINFSRLYRKCWVQCQLPELLLSQNDFCNCYLQMSLLCENCTLLVIPSALFQSIYTGGSKGRELSCITSWKNSQFDDYRNKILPLFGLSIVGPKQNARSLLTPVSDTDFYPLSCGTLQFVLHRSSYPRLFQWFWLVAAE